MGAAQGRRVRTHTARMSTAADVKHPPPKPLLSKLRGAVKAVQVGVHLASSPLASQCTAAGPGLTGNYLAQQVPTSFFITACGQGGALVTKGGADFKIAVRGPGRVEPELTDKGNGTYAVVLTYPMSGKYQVRITLERSAISNSPFDVTVQAAGKPAPPPAPRFATPSLTDSVHPMTLPFHPTQPSPIPPHRSRA